MRDVGYWRVVRQIERSDVVLGLHQSDRLGDLPHRPFDLRMAGVADENKPASLRHVTLALIVHLGDQRTGRVKDRKLARRGLFLDAFGDTMSAEDGDGVRRNLGEILDEMSALGLQALNDVLVVDDFVAHVDRRAIFLQSALDDLYGADHAGTETAGLSENYLH